MNSNSKFALGFLALALLTLASAKASYGAANLRSDMTKLKQWGTLLLSHVCAAGVVCWPTRSRCSLTPMARPRPLHPPPQGTSANALCNADSKNYDLYQAEAHEWAATSRPPAHFAARSPFVLQRLPVSRVNNVICAGGESAAAEAFVLSRAPVGILNFAVRGGTAYLFSAPSDDSENSNGG